MDNGENFRHEEVLKRATKALSSQDGNKNMCHLRRHGEPLPSQSQISQFVDICRSVLFPGFFGIDSVNTANIEYVVGVECEKLMELLETQAQAGLLLDVKCGETADMAQIARKAHGVAMDFVDSLPEMKRMLQTDIEAMYLGDPAAVSREEVVYCYPALKAITNYRIAHRLLQLGVPVIPRIITELAHSETGIDIHPGAEIGEYFAIDHGTGVVIGATAIIGNHVKLYQGVTLGAKSFDLDENNNPIKGIPRHPIIGDNVVIYSNASILGRISIGKNAVIGGNLWVTVDVAEGEKLVQAKANNILRFKSDE